jgi:4-hydroxy-tetrahydrodipicolinate reductase
MIRLVVAGATGRTGNPAVWAAHRDAQIELVACVGASATSDPHRPLPEGPTRAASLENVTDQYDVLLDLTQLEVARKNLARAREAGAHVVLGTTGFEEDELATLGSEFAANSLGLMYVPNFSIGAVTMMRIAEQLATTFDSVSIVETHRAGKADAPSGTALHTAERVGAARAAAGIGAATPAGDQPSLGQVVGGVPVHALRLEGAVAHQEVIFGSEGELLTIRHDAIDRSCYSAGALMAVKHVPKTTGLTVGLEQLL